MTHFVRREILSVSPCVGLRAGELSDALLNDVLFFFFAVAVLLACLRWSRTDTVAPLRKKEYSSLDESPLFGSARKASILVRTQEERRPPRISRRWRLGREAPPTHHSPRKLVVVLGKHGAALGSEELLALLSFRSWQTEQVSFFSFSLG